MLKVYIIGPTVGFPKLNLETFEKVAEVLVQMGLEPVVPHHLFHEEENKKGGLSIKDALERRLDAVCVSDRCIVIPGYTEDFYARQEAMTARQHNVPMVRLDVLKKQKAA